MAALGWRTRQIVVLGVTDHQLAPRRAQVSGIDDRNRLASHDRLSAGIVDICGDNAIDRDWPPAD